MESNESKTSFPWARLFVLAVLIAGAIYAAMATINAGRNNSSTLLKALFIGWVLLPFVGLIIASLIAKRWPPFIGATINALGFFISIVAVLGYAGILVPTGTRPTAVYLFIPFLSWLIIGIVTALATFISRKNKKDVRR